MTTGGTGSEMRRVALMWPSLAATTTSRDQVRRYPARGRQLCILSLHLKEEIHFQSVLAHMAIHNS
jgi:hypothetical protein